MSKISVFLTNFASESKNKSNVPSELKEKIQQLNGTEFDSSNLEPLLDIIELANSIPFYIPEVFGILFEDISIFFSLDESKIEFVLNTINHWQDWKTGIKFIEKISFQTQLKPEQWLILAEFTFKLGKLCYTLFKGSNYALTLQFFEKTLNFLSKSINEKKIHVILSSTIWFIGQIEFEKGYSIKASDYQLSSMYYQKNFTVTDFEEYFLSTRESMRNSFILSSFQAATEYFIAGKVAAQSFLYEQAKNNFSNSYLFVNRILRFIDEKMNEEAILTQLRTFLLQLHSIIDKEGFLLKHSCDFNVLSSQYSEISELIAYVRLHASLLEDRDRKIFWLSVLDQGGIALFEYDFEENQISSKNTLYSSFMHVVSKWGQIELESGPVQELNFLGNSFVIEVSEPIEVIAVVSKPSPEFHFALKNFATGFKNEFGTILQNNWDGNITIFQEKSLKLVKKIKNSLEVLK